MTNIPDMFAPTRGFSAMADSMEPCTMLWGRPTLVAITTKFGQIWAIFRQNRLQVGLYAR